MDGIVFWLFVYSVVWVLGVWVDIVFASASASASTFASSPPCWESDERCLISAQLFRSDSWGQIDLPIEIDCQPPFESLKVSFHDQKEPYLEQRFEHVQNVTLNGCSSHLNAETYGYEFLPNCGTIFKTTIERFHGDSMSKLQCHNPIEMEVLILRNNEITAFYADAFDNLEALREIYFKQNSVRHINRTTFENLPQIELIHVEHEEYLKIKEADFFQRTGVADLRLISLKNVHTQLLQHLPDSIRFLLLADMQIDDRKLKVRNPFALKNISVINCNLDSFILDDPNATVTFLNLSKNSITQFLYEANSSLHCVLRTLDLSANKLKYLSTEWFLSLQCLQVLLLQGNDLIELSMRDLILAVPSLSYIDLRDNQLEILGDTDAEFHIDCDNIRISVDRNPWNCLWLLNFTHTHPEKFRIFQYRKFISQINVNGLECQARSELHYLDKISLTDETLTSEKGTLTSSMNLSTYNLIYGNNRETKRNQRSEALIIVFMLPLGIALLFLLLYMWIYCQKMFHLSYYRTVPIIGKSIPLGSTDNCDVTTQLPTNSKNDYEMPLKGAISVCNCNHIGLSPNSSEEQCKKRHDHHITYEGAPNEKPFRLYEEIIGEDHHAEVAQTHPFYDHLTYVEGYQTGHQLI